MSKEISSAILDAQDALGFANLSAELIYMSGSAIDGNMGGAIVLGAQHVQDEIRKALDILESLKGGAA